MKSLPPFKLAHLLIVVALIAGLAGAAPTTAQVPETNRPSQPLSPAPQTRLADLLRPDGTLDRGAGYRGSVDARGYRLVSGSGSAPRFAAVPTNEANAALAPETLGNPGDENWAAGFIEPGTYNRVEALALSGDRKLYVGGDFTAAAGAAANHIALWDGASWSWSSLVQNQATFSAMVRCDS